MVFNLERVKYFHIMLFFLKCRILIVQHSHVVSCLCNTGSGEVQKQWNYLVLSFGQRNSIVPRMASRVTLSQTLISCFYINLHFATWLLCNEMQVLLLTFCLSQSTYFVSHFYGLLSRPAYDYQRQFFTADFFFCYF